MGNILIFISLLLYLSVYPNPSDTVFSDYTDSNSIFRPWLHTNADTPPLFTKQAALRGAMGLNVVYKDPAVIYQKAKFHNNSWQRFYFRIDSLGDSSEASKAFFTQGKQQREVSFLIYAVSQKFQKEQGGGVVDFKFEVDSKDSSLSLISTLHGTTPEKTSIPITRNHVYCIESNLSFFKPESVSLTCYIDGALGGQKKTGYLYPHEFFRVVITNDDRDYFLAEYGGNYSFTPFHFSIDEFAYSIGRPYTMPDVPSACSSIVHGGQVEMRCRYMKSGYFNEEIKMCRWQVFPFDSLPFPMFDVIETMPKYFYNRPIPFSLDNGKYNWRVCFMNNFGNWGDWSPFTEFTITGQQKKILVKNAYFTEKGQDKQISSITPGKWYDFHLSIDNRMGWGTPMFALVWVHDNSYTFGHIANRGGAFLAKSNYVYNFSLDSGKSGLFEKESENSISSILLGTDSPGVYLDVSNHGLVMDTSNGHIKFRTRFLPTANSGLWQVSAGVVYYSRVDSNNRNFEEESNIFRSTITIFPQKGHWKYFHFVSAFVFIPAIILSLFVLNLKYRRKKNSVSVQDLGQNADFQRIMDYIKLHYTEKIVITDIFRECHFSKSHFYNVMNRCNQNLPDIVRNFRIEKAKELLRTERERNIEEISLSVGYIEASNFSTAFKEIEGISPKDYRKQLGNI